jgi:A/G-specific adenine glycosylase
VRRGGEGTAVAEGADPARDAAAQRALVAWFRAAQRDLPWRRDRDPYRVLLSEVMLQQTRVETVIPYFERFLARFPDFAALASAPVDDVLALWSGLGYYRRARVLHLAAKEIVARYGGSVPADAAALRALPGVGAYTAGAVASLAFGLREPLVDGNVARVLSRLEALEDDAKSAAGARRLWEVAARLVPGDAPGPWNEGLMELGATVCLPREPRCEACPLAALCRAREAGRQAELPVVRAKKKPTRVRAVATVVEHGGEILFARRAEGGLFGGLWEPPMVEAATLADARAALAAAGLALETVRLRTAGRVKHVLSHRELDVLVVHGVAAERPIAPKAIAPAYERLAWRAPGAEGVGTSTLARKVLARALAPVPAPA